ncbi:hypothetical protein [Parafrankia sp. BMG5.11]|uniref:hypothetical protein n=1 Tax=Parafrankia sp. BMG5.11 TaxID=222540 RepID=UPI00103CD149|nr:hypothetical protein [Parafrankia sp. BMG5.11]
MTSTTDPNGATRAAIDEVIVQLRKSVDLPILPPLVCWDSGRYYWIMTRELPSAECDSKNAATPVPEVSVVMKESASAASEFARWGNGLDSPKPEVAVWLRIWVENLCKSVLYRQIGGSWAVSTPDIRFKHELQTAIRSGFSFDEYAMWKMGAEVADRAHHIQELARSIGTDRSIR